MQTILEVNLPGIPSQDVEVTSTPLPNGNHTLKVKARNKYGQTLSDTWVISGKYDLDQLRAKLELGVLMVEAPLKQSLQPRRIDVTAPSHERSLQ
jgi:HSP20 family molecular chaperone IbpA